MEVNVELSVAQITLTAESHWVIYQKPAIICEWESLVEQNGHFAEYSGSTAELFTSACIKCVHS
jgi:hypothetical protein